MKLLILSNFTFFHNVFLKLFSSVCQNEYILRKWLSPILPEHGSFIFGDNKLNMADIMDGIYLWVSAKLF